MVSIQPTFSYGVGSHNGNVFITFEFCLFINNVQDNETHWVSLEARLHKLRVPRADGVRSVCVCIPRASAQNVSCGGSLRFSDCALGVS